MTPDQRVLLEAERWFRSKLRGESGVLDSEQRLFLALAKRQNEAVDTYVPRDRPPDNTSSSRAEPLAATQPPPAADIQRELLRISGPSARERD